MYQRNFWKGNLVPYVLVFLALLKYSIIYVISIHMVPVLQFTKTYSWHSNIREIYIYHLILRIYDNHIFQMGGRILLRTIWKYKTTLLVLLLPLFLLPLPLCYNSNQVCKALRLLIYCDIPRSFTWQCLHILPLQVLFFPSEKTYFQFMKRWL